MKVEEAQCPAFTRAAPREALHFYPSKNAYKTGDVQLYAYYVLNLTEDEGGTSCVVGEMGMRLSNQSVLLGVNHPSDLWRLGRYYFRTTNKAI